MAHCKAEKPFGSLKRIAIELSPIMKLQLQAIAEINPSPISNNETSRLLQNYLIGKDLILQGELKIIRG